MNTLLSTCWIRPRSAITRGRFGARSMITACLPPPATNVLRACSTSAPTSAGSGETERVPVSIRPTSSRSPMRPVSRSACSSMMRKNCCISAGLKPREAPSTVAVEPLMAASGVRSSWLTMLRNSECMRSSSCSDARSCMVTTTDSTWQAAEWIGVRLISVVTLRPSATESTTSSACTVSALRNAAASENWSSAISRPSPRRQMIASTDSSIDSSIDRSGMRRLSRMRVASRLNETGRLVFTSNTATPTGDTSISASRSARVRCSVW